MTWTFMKFMDLCSRIQIKKRKKKCEFWFSNTFFPKPHAVSAKQCKKSLPSGFHGVWGRVAWSESPQVEPLWARHVKYTSVEQPAMCRAFVSLQRATLGKVTSQENWTLGVPHRLSKVREKECLSSQVGGGRFCKSLKMGTQQVCRRKEESRTFSGNSRSRFCSDWRGFRDSTSVSMLLTHRTEINLWGEQTPSARGSTFPPNNAYF